MLKNCDAAHQLLSLLNPISAAAAPESAALYAREPYVMSADVSYAPPYVGQGGWSWYTGSAGWMYQAIVNWFLGIRHEGSRLVIDPAVPASFGSFTVQYRFGSALYVIHIKAGERKAASVPVLTVDGRSAEDNVLLLSDDRRMHMVQFGYQDVEPAGKAAKSTRVKRVGSGKG
jgi:cellobiose phosphorylase